MRIACRLPAFLKKRIGSRIATPQAAPSSSESKTSQNGSRIDSATLPPPAPEIACAIVTEKPKATSATASSMATTLISVSVTGPRALYCLMTRIVAAGAVAAAMAPSTSANSTSNPNATSAPCTRKTATIASKIAITTGVKPTRLKYERLKVSPTVNAINASAISEIREKSLTIVSGRIFRTQGPMTSPATR